MIGVFDHALAAAFAVGFPLITGPGYLRRKHLLESGDEAARRREYVETILWLSSMGVATVVVWLVAARPPEALGLGFSTSWGGRLALALALGASGLLAWQTAAITRDPATREAARRALESVSEYPPRTPSEMRLFRGVAISAGIGEEIYYRGFVIWYLGQIMPLAAAVVASSVAFGLAHWMHGSGATIRATAMGLVLAGLYLLGGSLWAPMLLHTAVDLSSGESGAAIFGEGT